MRRQTVACGVKWKDGGNDVEEAVMGQLYALCQHLSGRTGNNHEEPHS
jgi:hypothetical protein